MSIGPVYDFADGRMVRAGVLVIAEALVAPRPLWELLQDLAKRSDWLCATFALSTRPNRYGMARASNARLVTSFSGSWTSNPRLTLIVARALVSESALELAVRRCVKEAIERDADDPFPAKHYACRATFFGLSEC